MKTVTLAATVVLSSSALAGLLPPHDPPQNLERTCFQTSQGYSDAANLRSDVAIVYGVDPGLPARISRGASAVTAFM